jgi:hypothetical protein
MGVVSIPSPPCFENFYLFQRDRLLYEDCFPFNFPFGEIGIEGIPKRFIEPITAERGIILLPQLWFLFQRYNLRTV